MFVYQCVNDHSEVSFHQPVMVTRKDLGVSDEEWVPMRDNCWMQRYWSASVTPKGAFFCEIAAALDMLFDGPGGWPIEKGWWKRQPEEFGEQLRWCEWCGLALETRSRDANEGPDDASPSFIKRLETVGSPKLKRGLVRVYQKEGAGDGALVKHKDYQENDFNRLGAGNRKIYPQGFLLGILDPALGAGGVSEPSGGCGNTADTPGVSGSGKSGMRPGGNPASAGGHARLTHDSAKGQFDEVVFLGDKRFGNNANRANKLAGNRFVVLAEAGVCFAPDFVKTLEGYVLNPGTMHFFRTGGEDRLRLLAEGCAAGKLMLLYHPQAHAVRDHGFDGVAWCADAQAFMGLWAEGKRVLLDDDALGQKAIEDRIRLEPGKRYMVYGAGGMARAALRKVREAGGDVVGFCDSDPGKWGKELLGKKVFSPEEMKGSKGEFDKIVIGSWQSYGAIRKAVLELGFAEGDMAAPLLLEGEP